MLSYPELPRPAIFAHRGSSAHAPENTFAAFELAVNQDCDGIELDVMLSGDMNLIVIHDSDVSRTTGFKGKVAELSVSILKQLDAGSYFDVEFKNEKIPLLEEILEQFGNRTLLNIELKNYESIFDNLPDQVAKVVKNFNLQDSVLISSFNPIALVKFRRLLPQTPIGLLALPRKSGWWSRSSFASTLLRYDALHPEIGDVTKPLIDRSHTNSKRIHAYTANHPEDLARLFEMNVDGVFTDDPLMARSILTGQFPGTSVLG